MPPIPERLIQNGRPPIQEFNGAERLFHRFNSLMHIGDWLCPSSVRFPDFSVNREMFSDPLDVLLPCYETWGVASFKVDDIPDDIIIGEAGDTGDVIYSFFPFHIPIKKQRQGPLKIF